MNLNPQFVTGFCEGEAAFTFSRSTTRKMVRTVPRFSIRRRVDGGDVLQRIQQFFGIGALYPCRARGKTEETLYYVVTTKEDLPVVVKHFQDFPLVGVMKRKIFNLWSEMVEEYCRSAFGADYQELECQARLLTSMQLRPRGFRLRSSVGISVPGMKPGA